MPRRREPNAAANAAKTKEEAQIRACNMERAVMVEIAQLHWCLNTNVDHQRFLSFKYVADRYLADLRAWLRKDSQKRACGADFVRDIKVRLDGLAEQIRELQERSQARPAERRRRRRELRQHRAEQALIDERHQAQEALERAQQRVRELEEARPVPVDSSSSGERADAGPPAAPPADGHQDQ